MTAVVAPLPLPSSADIVVSECPAEARKRRREMLDSLRDDTDSSSIDDVSSEVAPKKRKTALDDSSTGTRKKKPQMKYDPDVPMTKEEAAAWRREQRRKRNRESAAASRQRQRDRITELEVEVEEWKAKFEGVMSKIKELQGLPSIGGVKLRATSPLAPPLKMVSPRESPLAPTSSGVVIKQGSIEVSSDEEDHEELCQPKMISRQA